jgi:CRISPR-associated protein Cmr2
VFYLRNLAEQLLKSAKERAKQLRKRRYYGGTIDFLALKSVTMLSGSVEQFRRATQQRGAPRGDEEDGHGERSRGAARREGKRFYARPYTLAETEALLKSVRRLKQSDFPRSQLYRLRESLRAGEGRERGTVDYLYFLTRNADAARREIEDLWTPVAGSPPPHPWLRRIAKSSRPGEPEWETVWGDIIELYDFVEEEDGDAVGED